MKIINLPLEKENIDKNDIRKDIEKLLLSISYEPIWQTVDWNLMLQKTWYANKWFFIWLYDQDLVNFVIIEKRGIWLWKFAFFIIWWPVNDKNIDVLEEEIIKVAKQEAVIYTQIEPLIDVEFKYFKEMKLKKFIEPFTVLLDLWKTEEELLSEMKPKWRYNIKVAEKIPLIILMHSMIY